MNQAMSGILVSHPDMVEDTLDYRHFLYDHKEPHLTTAVRADERVHFVSFIDQSHPGPACGLAEWDVFFGSFLKKSRSRQYRLRLYCLSFSPAAIPAARKGSFIAFW